jgi:Sugar phosphate permease
MFLSFSLVNPPLAESLGVGLSQVMLYNSIMALAGAVSMTVLAPWALARFGARTLVIVGGAWTAAVLFAFSFATSLAMLYVLALLMGASFSLCTNLAASVLVNSWFESYRGTVLGAVFAVSGLGGVSMGFVMPQVVASGGWQMGFRLLAVLLGTLTIVPGILLIRSTPEEVGLLPFGATTTGEAEDGEAHVVVPGVPRATAFRTSQFIALLAAIILGGGGCTPCSSTWRRC